jgi:polyisoprenoid-binding protein YceI
MSSTTLPVIAPGTYRIDPKHTIIRFTTRHLFGLGGVRGTFAVRDGTVVVAADPRQSRATAVVDAASFDTGNPRRDKDVRSTNFLAAEAYPDISFTSTELAADAAGNWTLTGSLTVRDATSNLTLILGDASGHRFRATTRIDRYAFGVTRGKGMAARYLDLDLDIVLR